MKYPEHRLVRRNGVRLAAIGAGAIATLFCMRVCLRACEECVSECAPHISVYRRNGRVSEQWRALLINVPVPNVGACTSHPPEIRPAQAAADALMHLTPPLADLSACIVCVCV